MAMSEAPELDPILVDAVAKALVREKMLQIAGETGTMAMNPDYLTGAVDKLWEGTDVTAATQRKHYRKLATIAIEVVHGFEAKVVEPLAIIPTPRPTPILENTGAVHQQVPGEDQRPQNIAQRLEAPLAHPVDSFPTAAVRP